MEPITWEQVKATIRAGHIQWAALFDERQLNEIELDVHYTQKPFGTEGHNARLVVAKMAAILDAIAGHITFTMEDEEPK